MAPFTLVPGLFSSRRQVVFPQSVFAQLSICKLGVWNCLQKLTDVDYTDSGLIYTNLQYSQTLL